MERYRSHETAIEKIEIPFSNFTVVAVITMGSEKLKNVKEEMRNVHIFFQDGEGKPIVELSSLFAQDKKISLLVGGEHSDYDYENRIVTTTVAELRNNPRELFVILHEMGHIATYDKKGREHRDVLGKIQSKREDPVSDDELKIVIKNERNAWTEAIRFAHSLKQKYNINLFEMFENVDVFMGWLRITGLRTYESGLELRGVKSFTKNKQVALWEEAVRRESLSPMERRIVDMHFNEGNGG